MLKNLKYSRFFFPLLLSGVVALPVFAQENFAQEEQIQEEQVFEPEPITTDEVIEQHQDQLDLLDTRQMELQENFKRFRDALPFDFFGSLAVRHCAMANEKLDVLGNVLQMRLSAGIRGTLDQNWGYSLRLLSNQNDSFNLSWYPFGGSPIARSPLFLDRYEVSWHTPQQSWQPEIALKFGKSRNTLFETQLLFDEDVSFNGLQQRLSWRNRSSASDASLLRWKKTDLEFHEDVLLIENTFITASLLAAKAVNTWGNKHLELRSSVGYLHYLGTDSLATQQFNTGYRGPYSELNRTVVKAAEQHGYVSDFRLLNASGRVKWSPFDGWPPLVGKADVVYNAGAKDRNLGWLVGAEIGALKTPGDFKLDYAYRWMEQDYQVALFADEFYSGNDVQGNTLSLSYLMAEKTHVIATIITRQRITQPELGLLTIAYLTLRQDF